ncbi:MAG: chemotaxis protein CheD [Salinigranum sp.]
MRTFERDPDVPERDRVLVGVSEYRVADAGETLVVYGLGACVAVALYDSGAEIGALAHALLPARREGHDVAPGKFVDSAVRTMLREMVEAGAGYADVEARLVGGADVYELPDLSGDAGERNVAAARRELARLDIPVVAEAVGGTRGRAAEFDTATGTIRVRSVGRPSETL